MSKIPLWAWVAGGGVLLVGALLLTGRRASSVDTTGQSSGFADQIGQLTSAVSNLQGSIQNQQPTPTPTSKPKSAAIRFPFTAYSTGEVLKQNLMFSGHTAFVRASPTQLIIRTDYQPSQIIYRPVREGTTATIIREYGDKLVIRSLYDPSQITIKPLAA